MRRGNADIHPCWERIVLWRVALGLTCALTVALLGGCGSKSKLPPCFPVHGQVLRAGKPLPDAVVMLHPVSVAAEVPQKPVAYTDAEGRFGLTTYNSSDGAPAGQYAVTVELRAPRLVGEETVRDGRNLLPVRYSKPETSKLTATVAEGENVMPPIDLPVH